MAHLNQVKESLRGLLVSICQRVLGSIGNICVLRSDIDSNEFPRMVPLVLLLIAVTIDCLPTFGNLFRV